MRLLYHNDGSHLTFGCCLWDHLSWVSQDVRGLFLFAAVMVMAAALAVHFKLGDIYRALLYSYTIR